MPDPEERGENSTQELVRRMSAGTSDVVDRTIPFVDDDVPKYLAALREFREESRKVEIIVR